MDIKELIRTGIFSIGRLVNNKADASRVIFYHDIHAGRSFTSMSTPLDLFKSHVEVIRKQGFEIVRDIDASEGEIQIAFDDGFRGILDCADWLVSKRIYPTIFIPTSLIGKEGYLSESKIVDLHDMGFNIQSHGVRHSNMSVMTVDELFDDLTTSKAYFTRLLDKPIDSICFPQGYYSDLVVFESLKAGYKKLYTSVPGRCNISDNLKYRTLFQTLSPLQARLVLHGGMDILMSHYKAIHYNGNRHGDKF